MRDALSTYLKVSGLDRKMGTVEIFDVWNRACGSSMAAHSKPVQFRNGTLTVEVSSAPHLHELAGFQGETFRHAANKMLDKPRIRRVDFKLKR